jgi:flavocytochrome c
MFTNVKKEPKMTKLTKVTPIWDYEADIIVVGYGGSGAAAAIESYDSGSNVIIIEKESLAGGTTSMSGGMIVGAGTSVQKARHVSDSPEEMYKYFKATGQGLENPDLMRVLCDKSAANIEWLIRLGMEFNILFVSGAENYPEFAAITPPKPRGHIAQNGRIFFKVLKNACDKRGIKAFYNTRLTEVITSLEGEVRGIKAESEGKMLNFKARKAVILACGGYAYNKEMLKQYSFDKGCRAIYTGSPSHTGDGIRAGQMLGADLVCMGQIGAIPSVQRPGQKIARLLPYIPAVPGVSLSIIAVNKQGKRFINESGYYNYVAYDMLLPGNLPNYFIFDQKVRISVPGGWPPWSGDHDRDIEEGTTKKESNIRELALKIGVDPHALEETITNYNTQASQGHDPEFGRTSDLAPLQTPPFYALERVVGMHSTLGGLKINVSAQVINVKGEVIPRLYAAGETSGGAIGLNYPASGTAIQNAICFGRIAGKKAGEEISW